MRLLRAILLVMITLLATSGSVMAQRKIIQVQGGRRTVVAVRDSLAADSLKIVSDTLLTDSARRVALDSLRTKSLKNSAHADSLSYLNPKLKADSMHKSSADSLAAKSNLLTRQFPERKFKFTRDTISSGALFGLSLVPGVGQIYNRQYWKVPVFYAGIGAFLTAGILTSNTYNDYRTQFQHATSMNMPNEVTDPLKRKMQNAGSIRTVMYSLAAVTYLYQVADATFNYRGYSNPVRKATTLAAVFPGAGFIYTKTYWRIPIYYGGFIALGTVVDYNNRSYQRYKTAYNAMTDGDPTTMDEFRGRYSADAIRNARDGYRRDRDFGIICLSAAYLLSVIDTYVIATLKNWDVSRDLSVKVEPTWFNAPNDYRATALPSGAGLSLKINF